MDAKEWIDVTFTMTDGTSRRGRWHQTDVAQRTADITVKPRGEVRAGVFPFQTWRRLQVEYRVCASVSGSACNQETEERQQPGGVSGYHELLTQTP